MENLKKRIEYAAKELKENPPDSPEDDPARGQTEKQIPLPLVEQQKRHKELHEMKVERKRMILAASQSLYLEGQIRGLRGEWEGKAHALQSSIKLLTGADFVVSPDDDKAQALTSSPVVNSIRLSKLFYQIGICAEKQGKIDEAATAYGLVLQSWANHCSPNAPVRTTIQSLLANVAERKALAHMEAFGNTSVSSMPFLHSKYQAIMQMAAEEANRSAAAGSNSSAPLMSV